MSPEINILEVKKDDIVFLSDRVRSGELLNYIVRVTYNDIDNENLIGYYCRASEFIGLDCLVKYQGSFSYSSNYRVSILDIPDFDLGI